ncbi:MAG TPA: glucosyl-3-phosphoglycerate synthase [Actinomycetota bacterium]|nr:glucosyl-3-phosphoglycerate synthase [Actinomycetota bacterium]
MSQHIFDPVARGWFERRTFSYPDLDPTSLIQAKQDRNLSVAVCCPALNEAVTIGPICARIRDSVRAAGLVDELLVIDSGSTDGTRVEATDAGATVFSVDELVTQVPPAERGKGDSLWRSLAAVRSDIVVWLDADLEDFDERFITHLLAPLLLRTDVSISKGFYERPIGDGDRTQRVGGARVTELTARPLLNLLWPELSGFVQPLSGEYAGYTSTLRTLPFFIGYGVEVGLLIDASTRLGIDAVAQVDLGVRRHRNRPVLDLGATALEVIGAILNRAEDLGRLKLAEELTAKMVQFVPDGDTFLPRIIEGTIGERPPLDSVL